MKHPGIPPEILERIRYLIQTDHLKAALELARTQPLLANEAIGFLAQYAA